jgi:hypothetical protein
MTTFATDRTQEELAQRERDAWSRYSDRLRDLHGPDYDDAERDSWAELQADLRLISSDRDAADAEAQTTA